jgi:hypothetical protein
MYERTAKQPQRELGEVPQGVVVPERFGNRYRFSSQVFWSTSFLGKSYGQRISDRRMGGNMDLLYLGGSQKRYESFPPDQLYWHSAWPLQQQRTYQPEDIEPTQRGQVPKRFSRPIGRIGLLYRRRLAIDTVSSFFTDKGRISDSKLTTTIQRSRIEV